MKERTELEIRCSSEPLRAYMPAVGIGSCFADNMTGCMNRALWPAVNPAGVLYNPVSISKALHMLTSDDGEEEFAATLFPNEGGWFSWAFDSHMSGPDRETVMEKFRKSRREVKSRLKGGALLMVTLGTTGCYSLATDRMTVANCHKQPQRMFERFTLGLEGVVAILADMVNGLQSRYPGLQTVFTVSPVRYVKDGLEESSLSKATLRLAVDRVCRESGNCRYFPAYEIMVDDLRDYRYYGADLVHPSETAVGYIWDAFKRAMFSEADRSLLAEGEALWRREHHRPLLDWRDDRAFRGETERLVAQFRSKTRLP